MMKSKIIAASLLSLSMPVTALAKDDCTKAKDIINVVKSFHAPKPELVDKIKPDLNLSLKALGDYPEPTGLLYRHGEERVTLELDENGRVLGLEKALAFNKDGELCKVVNGQVPVDDGEDTTQANMSFKFIYPDGNGSHNMADIYEGAKDGSKIMKSLAPGGLGFVVPGLKTLVVKPKDEGGAMPTVRFLMKGTDVPMPKSAVIGSTRLFKLKDIKTRKADTMLVQGLYKLEANFKISDEDIAKAQAEAVKEVAATE